MVDNLRTVGRNTPAAPRPTGGLCTEPGRVLAVETALAAVDVLQHPRTGSGGIFSGMNSPLDADAVLSGLGDKFLLAFASAVAAARTDINEMRAWRPGWFPTMHSRCLSNLIHDRIWAHLVEAVEADKSAVVHESGPTREVQVGMHFLIRIKRHRRGNAISTYPTETALAFWTQGSTQALDGLELTTLAAGYRWDPDLRAIQAPVLSYRDGRDNPIWAVELDEPHDGTASITWTPLPGPQLPTIDFGDLNESDETGTADNP